MPRMWSPEPDQARLALRERRRVAAARPAEEEPRREPPAHDPLGRPLTDEQYEAWREDERSHRELLREVNTGFTSVVRDGPPTLKELNDALDAARLRVPEIERLLPAAAARVAKTAAAAGEAEAAYGAAHLAASAAAGPCAGITRLYDPRPGEPVSRAPARSVFVALDEGGMPLAGEELGRRREAFEALPENERKALVAAFNRLRAEAEAARERWDRANEAAATAQNEHRDLANALTFLVKTKIPGLVHDIPLHARKLERGLAEDGDAAGEIARAHRAVEAGA